MSRREEGISLVLVSLLGTGLLLMTGIAGDVGMVLYTKHRMQTAADAAALAGARVLFYEGRAEAVKQAQALSNINGFSIANSAINITTGDTRAEVTFKSPQGLVLGTLVTSPTVNVPVRAVAERVIRRYGLRPFGIPDDPYVPETVYTIKQAPGGTVTSGNFQPLALGENGAKPYGQYISFGSRSEWNIGDMVQTEPGNVSGPTTTEVNGLVAANNSVIVAPMIDKQMYFDANGRSVVKITDFALWDLQGSTKGAVTAKFIRRLAVEEWPGTITGSRLVE